MSPEPSPDENMSVKTLVRYILNCLGIYGVVIGIVLVSFEFQESGIFSPTHSFFLISTGMGLLILGILITAGSFLCLGWCWYGKVCPGNPDIIIDLTGPGSFRVKIFAAALIGLNFLVIGLLLLYSFPLIVSDFIILLLFLLGVAVMDYVLWALYQDAKAREHGDLTYGPGNRKMVLFVLAIYAIIIALYLLFQFLKILHLSIDPFLFYLVALIVIAGFWDLAYPK